jgi:serine/threonine-protein kinase
LWKDEVREALLPALGTTVGGYYLEARLGRGGQGTVYRARRGGTLYAVKFIYLPQAGSRARTEVEVLPRLERVGLVKLEGHGYWPDASRLFLFIAMRYVRGRPLRDWARERDLTARQVAQVLRELARQVAAMHGEGVVHRDVKGANVLVGPDDQPVLVDFGLSTWPRMPRHTLGPPPGTWSYRSPEVWRFLRERQSGEHYTAGPLDDVWALGVLLYWLLTDTYPFDEADEPAQQDAVLTRPAEPPQVRNPQVPQGLGALCLRLLEKDPQARLPGAEALAVALKEALETADAAWDVPLAKPGSTLEGRAPLPEELATLQPPTRTAPASAEGATPEEPPAAPVSARSVPGRGLAWSAVGGLLVWALLAAPRSPAPASVTAWVAPGVPPLAGWGAPGQEVAPPWKPPEGEGGAALSEATPAPVASATLPQDTRMKTSRRAPPPQDMKPGEKSPPPSASAAGTCVALWAMGQLACTGPAAQVRPLTPADCPPEAQKVMRERSTVDTVDATFPIEGSSRTITVRRGPGASVELTDRWGGAPPGTVLTGELVFGEERVYGRFTEARTPDGKWFPICAQLKDYVDGQLGVKLDGRPGPDTALVLNVVRVEPVGE